MRTKNTQALQFVSWFPEWRGLYFIRLEPKDTPLAYVYEWILGIAFWEIRKWSHRPIPKK